MPSLPKPPRSWRGRLDADTQAPTPPPLDIPVPAENHEPPSLGPTPEQVRIRELEIREKVTMRELYLAKARILELELAQIGIAP